MIIKLYCPLCNQKLTPKARQTADENLANGIIALYKKRQKTERLPCPRCGRNNMSQDVSRNALSRICNVQICDQCGTEEAIEALKAFEQGENLSGIISWWLVSEIIKAPEQ